MSLSDSIRYLCLVLLFKSIAIVLMILYAEISLGPDEAQYWTWSQALDWGYYSKPPGIAWQTWLGTQIFGNTELGVRIFSIILSIFQSFAIYLLALRCHFKPSTAFWCGTMMALIPAGILGSFLAITDGGFLIFWTLACIFFFSAIQEKQEPNPFLIGMCLLAGALFKWPIYFFWIFFFFFRWKFFSQQKITKSLGGVFLSLLGLLPSVWWNYSHDWATFRHVLSTVKGGHATAIQGNLVEFFASQIFLFSPLLFIFLVLACFRGGYKRFQLPLPIYLCLIMTGGSFVIIGTLSLFQKIQGNWAIFAYPTAIILIGWYTCEWLNKGKIWLQVGLFSSVLMITSVLFTISLLPYKSNPFKHNIGWTQLAEALKKQGYDPKEHFLISDKYQTASLLSFYGQGQKRAYFLNLQGIRNNQFSYWPGLQEKEKGKVGFFVWVENAPHLQKEWQDKRSFYQKELENFFEKVDYIGMYPLLYQNAQITKGAIFFKCSYCTQQFIEKNSLY